MNGSAKPVRVILADDHTLVRAGIRALLEKLPEVQVVGEADDGREVLKLVATHKPDVGVIILSMHHNVEYVWQALKAGALGYLLKKAATAELATALQRVAQKEIYLSQEISSQLPRTFFVDGVAKRKTPLEQLTGRQREILQLIAEGQNTKAIAETLKISPKTVEYHRAKLMESLNVHDITGLV